MLDVAVIEDAVVAQVSLEPLRRRLLTELREPGSATTLAASIGLPRQQLNYHLRTLEQHGLVELVEERRKGNCTERILRASARAYVISPAALGAAQPDPANVSDRLSARWLVALASQLVRDVGELITGATAARQRVATFGLEADVQFATPADRTAFASELTDAVSVLVAKYHDASAEDGRNYRLVVALHPSVRPAQDAHAN